MQMTRRAMIMALTAFSAPRAAWAQEGEDTPEQRAARLDGLFSELKKADAQNAPDIPQKIDDLWSQSGSATIDLLLKRGRKAMTAGHYEAALAHLSRAVAFAPNFAEGWNTRATVYFLNDELGRSLADIQRTLALEPRHFGALSGLGLIMERINEPAKALEAYRAALAIYPEMEAPKGGVERLSLEVEGQPI